MLCKSSKLLLLAAFALALAGRGFAQTALGSITITGAEQSSGSTWDTGTVTATINGVSVSFAYGRYTTPTGVASALGALISKNCNMPVYAKATGNTLTFYQKGSNTITSASITSVSNVFPTNSFLVAGGGTWSLPQIDSLSFTEGPPGMGVTITGADFGPTQGSVTIGGETATIVSWSSDGTSIIVQVPDSLAPSSFAYTLVVSPSSSTFEATGVFFQVDPPFGCN
jgi:hypothetical protein